MLLFKYKHNKEPIVGVSAKAYFGHSKLPKVSPFLILLIVILGVLCWYPSFMAVQEKMLAVKQKQQKLLQRDQQVQRLINQTEKPIWLSDYPWLTWHTETATAQRSKKAESGKPPLLLYISLQGVSNYQDWTLVLNRLMDEYSLRPKFEQIYWLESGLIDVNIELQLVPKKYALKNYLFFPRRIYRDWPKDIEVLAALEWQSKRSLKIRIGELDLSLEQGDWVPELAANVVLLDDQRAVFRQQYGASTQNQTSPTELILDYFNRLDLKGVTLIQEERGPVLNAEKAVLAYQNGEMSYER